MEIYTADDLLYFPAKSQKGRIDTYSHYERLFLGEHYDAFNISTPEFGTNYSLLRYITANFAGLISKLSADMLFEEFPTITLGKKGDTDFFDAMMLQNRLKPQIYESGLEQSYNGDVVFRIRAENNQLIIEDINPAFYFPEINEDNVRAEPTAHTLAWKIKLAGNNLTTGRQRWAIFKERHMKGKIVNELWEIEENGKIVGQLDIDAWMTQADGTPYPKEVETNVDDFLVVHIPNYRTNSRYFGISDYKDLTSLMFAVNNRITKVDNILDKHGDPILAVPAGVLDETGAVKRQAFGVIEVDSTEAGGGKPEYIVWDAKLESAFSEIDKLVDFLMMFSESSPTLFGLDKGGFAESGRALKFRLLRTLAKKHRKQLYYDVGLHDLFYTAQKFAKKNKLQCGDVKMTKEPQMPIIKWQDGVINDALEQLEIEERRVEAGFSTKADAIASLDGLSEDEALKKAQEVQKEKQASMPDFSTKPQIIDPSKQGGNQNNNAQ
jgi:hypothetical protein